MTVTTGKQAGVTRRSLSVLMLELGWQNTVNWQVVAEVPAWKRTIRSFLPVNHQMIQIEHFARPRVVPVVFEIIVEIGVFDDDVVAVLVVLGQLVDGVGDRVGFDDKKQRPVASTDLDEPRLAEPIAGIDDRHVFQVVAVECATGGDLAHAPFSNSRFALIVSPMLAKRVLQGFVPTERRDVLGAALRAFRVASARPLVFPLVAAVRTAILDVQKALFVLGVEFGEPVGQITSH